MNKMARLKIVNDNIYNDEFLSFDEMIDIITELSFSQGFYGRLLRDINELDDETLNEVKNLWENKKFTNNVDFIMWLENGE